MASIEIISIDEDGVSKKNFDELTEDEKLSLEVEVDLATVGLEEAQLVCVVCLAFIPNGSGFVCEKHK